MDIKEEEFNHTCNILSSFGIETHNEDGSLRYFNEVMIDVAAFLRKRRSETDIKTFTIEKTCILNAILGKRYMNEFMN